MRRITFLVVAAGLLAPHPVSGGAAAPARGPAGAVTAHRAVAEGPAGSYWTPARMRAAIPRVLVLSRAPSGAADRGVPQRVAGTRAVASDHESNCVEESLLAPYEYERCDIENPRPRPWKRHGRVFMTFGALDYVCSGTVVRSRIERLVWTAGHCLVDETTGEWATNVTFVPAYDEGAAPLGTWSATRLFTTTRWRQDANLNYDVGAFRVGKRNGQTLQDVTGARGIAFNQRRNQTYNTFGYPAAGSFDGDTLVVCHTAFAENDPAPEENGPGPAPMGVGCDMTEGSSGGGWINDGDVHSVNSFHLAGQDEVMYGPYLGDTARRLWRTASGAA